MPDQPSVGAPHETRPSASDCASCASERAQSRLLAEHAHAYRLRLDAALRLLEDAVAADEVPAYVRLRVRRMGEAVRG